MKTQALLIFAIIVSFTISEAKRKTPKPHKSKAKLQRFLKTHSYKSREAGLVFARLNKSRWELMKKLQRHIPAKKFSELKSLGDKLKINYKKPINFATSEKFVIGKLKYKFDQNKSFRQQFYEIKKLYKKQSHYFNWMDFIFPRAEAQSPLDLNDSLAYDTLTLLYYLDRYEAGDGTIMEDLFFDSEDIQRIMERHQGKGIQVKLTCYDDSIDMEFSNGMYSTLEFKSRDIANSTDFTLTESVGNAYEDVANISNMNNKGLVETAWFYYCQKLAHRNLQVDGFFPLDPILTDQGTGTSH